MQKDPQLRLPLFDTVTYLWPCVNCHIPKQVSRSTYDALQQGTLDAFWCPDCLLPPPESKANKLEVA